MKTIKSACAIEKDLVAMLKSYPLIMPIVQSITECKGQAFLVGGAVRDLFLRRPIKDIDIEVHGVSLDQLEKVLKTFGPVSLVGKSFGVLKLHGLDVDWSLPRVDKAGRKPEVIIDPTLTIEEAFRRRDLTINAMGIDLITHELVDPFGGLDDLHSKILRAPDTRLFVEDPLRLFRVMQFIGRFEMHPSGELNDICSTMDISGVSGERICAEFEKLLMQSAQPSLGIRWLRVINRLQEVLPEIYALIGVPQDPSLHPEGDVFEHTMQTVDAAAALEYQSEREKLIVTLGALCHDLGKIKTTAQIDGRWRSLGHAHEGVEIARRLLNRFVQKQDVIDSVVLLVRYHLSPFQLPNDHASPAAYKRLARKLAPLVTMTMLAQLALADYRGRNPQPGKPLVIQVELLDVFMHNARTARVEMEPEAQVLHGRDLAGIVEPGPLMGEFLREAYEIQVEEGITDKAELITKTQVKMKTASQGKNKKA